MSHIDLNSIKLYHIVHIDKLPLILNSGKAGRLICDSDVQQRHLFGTTIGMSKIKERRMNEITLDSHPDLYVGDCVPFYFYPMQDRVTLMTIAIFQISIDSIGMLSIQILGVIARKKNKQSF